MRTALWLACLACPATLYAATLSDSLSRTSGTTHTTTDAPARMIFGASVAISGNVAFVGEPRGQEPGTVHIYARSAAGWRPSGTLHAPTTAPNDGFGAVIATDGTSLLVYQSGTAADSARGTVHVYRKSAAGMWTNSGVVQAPTRTARAAFGSTIVFEGDRVYIGAPGEGTGAVHVFRRSVSGSYEAIARMAGDGTEVNDAFGTSITIDGDRMAIGAPARAARRGGVFVYRRQSDGSWKQEALVVSARGAENARFGQSVQLSGTRLAVGAPGALPVAGMGGNAAAGLVTIFDYSEIAEIWRERQSFTQFTFGPARLGTAIVRAGNELWLSAPSSDRNTGAIQRLR